MFILRMTTILTALAIPILSATASYANETQDRLRAGVLAFDRKDYGHARSLIQPLAEAGEPFAEWVFGDMHSEGLGVPRSASEAIKWWMRAAEKGEPNSQLRLGDTFMRGRGVPENWTEAVKWWRKAAEQDLPRAQTAMGLALHDGRGVQQDRIQAAKWFQKAADQGQAQAQAMLAKMYLKGDGGLPQSLLEAYKWVVIAGEEAKELTHTTKGMLEVFLRKSEQQEAIRLAQQWKFEKGLMKNPPQPPERDEDIPSVYFFNIRQLSAKCSSATPSDIAWCEAYIAGVVDTLGSRRNLSDDAKDTRLCLRNKRVSLRQAREATTKVLAMLQEDKNSPMATAPALNSVVAGILTNLCE